MNKVIIVNGVRYVPEEKKSPTQGYTDRELINMAAFERDENKTQAEYDREHYERHRVV